MAPIGFNRPSGKHFLSDNNEEPPAKWQKTQDSNDNEQGLFSCFPFEIVVHIMTYAHNPKVREVSKYFKTVMDQIYFQKLNEIERERPGFIQEMYKTKFSAGEVTLFNLAQDMKNKDKSLFILRDVFAAITDQFIAFKKSAYYIEQELANPMNYTLHKLETFEWLINDLNLNECSISISAKRRNISEINAILQDPSLSTGERAERLRNLSKTYLSTLKLSKLELDAIFLTRIPIEITQMTTLKQLYLSDNRLTRLPAELGRLTQLEKLDLSDNFLSTLPSEIGHLKNLEELFLNKNKLTELPQEMTKLTNLKVLDLCKNHLKSLSKILLSLPQLKDVNIQGNPIKNSQEIEKLFNQHLNQNLEIKI